jgi:hypothetical protein
LKYQSSTYITRKYIARETAFPQNEISALPDILVTNKPCGKTAFSQKKIVSHKLSYKMTWLTVGLLMMRQFYSFCPLLNSSPLYNGYRVFPGGKGGRGVMLTTHPLLVPRLKKSWAIPPLTLWVFLGLLRGSTLPPPR